MVNPVEAGDIASGVIIAFSVKINTTHIKQNADCSAHYEFVRFIYSQSSEYMNYVIVE